MAGRRGIQAGVEVSRGLAPTVAISEKKVWGEGLRLKRKEDDVLDGEIGTAALARIEEAQDEHLRARLNAIDWNFGERRCASPLESVHPYPAKFIGDIPRSFIEAIGLPKGTIILDPFCGSGATLVESQRLGREAVGIDLNPIACLLSRVKCAPLPHDIQKTWADLVLEARCSPKNCDLSGEIPNLDHWFQPQVTRALAALVGGIRKSTPNSMHDFLFAALSSIIVRVSNQDSDTRYAAVAKTVSRDDVFDGFENSCSRLEKSLRQRDYPLTTSRVIQGDTLATAPESIGRNVGLVVTSPPYPNAYEYWLYHKYRMWWLGYDPIEVREHEIGARPHYFKKNHQTEHDFIGQMERLFNLLSETIVPGGHACFVIGRSKIHGRLIDNAEILREAAHKLGFSRVYERERIIRSTRKSFNLSHANIKTETLLVFRA